MSFRKPFTAKRVTAGTYVNGVFVPGTNSTFTIQASIQPLSDIDLSTLPEGQREGDLIKLYTDTELYGIGAAGSGQEPDKVVWQGSDYTISSKSVRQMGIISHFRYFAIKDVL